MTWLARKTRLIIAMISFVLLSSIVVAPQSAQASPGGADWVAVAAGYQHTCGLDTFKRISCWGNNEDGQLGNGTNESSDSPSLISLTEELSGLQFAQVSASYTHTCAITVDGVAYCWGKNDQGQLGVLDVTGSNVPLPVDTSGALSGLTLTQIDTGFNHTCALSSDNQVACWGGNDDGQVGNGVLTASEPSPVLVDTSGVLAGKTLKEIGVGSIATCALDTDGQVYCWGYGREGQMGDGLGTILNPFPIAVKTSGVLDGKTIAHISVGDAGVCAIDAEGALYCWGLNGLGQLGNGTLTTSFEPVAVSSAGILTTQVPSDVAAGGTFGCALTGEGRLSCWGDGSQGQLGNGKASANSVAYQSSTPVNVIQTGAGVMSGITIKQLSTGFAHTCVVGTTGQAFCWGLNDNGQLGNGVTTYTPTGFPVVVKDPPPAPPILSDSDAVASAGTVDEMFIDTQVAEKASGLALRFAIKSGDLPPGLVINKLTGLITGTPTEEGVFESVVRIFNPGGQVWLNLTITITKVPDTKPTPSGFPVVLNDNLSATSGVTRGMALLPNGMIRARLKTMYAGPITGKITVIYRNQKTQKFAKHICRIKPFGQLKKNPKALIKKNKFRSYVYLSAMGCRMPSAARASLKTDRVQVIINLYFQRRWPTTYRAITPKRKKLTPWIYQVAVTAGKGKPVVKN